MNGRKHTSANQEALTRDTMVSHQGRNFESENFQKLLDTLEIESLPASQSQHHIRDFYRIIFGCEL